MIDLNEIDRILSESVFQPGQPAAISMPYETVRELIVELDDARLAMREIHAEAGQHVGYNPGTDRAFRLIRDTARAFIGGAMDSVE